MPDLDTIFKLVDPNHKESKIHQLKQLIAFKLLLLISNLSLGQILIEGYLVDKESNDPVSFASIGISELGIGTVSNVNGDFRLLLNDSLKQEVITVSCVGYEKTSLSIPDIQSAPEGKIYLSQQVNMLEGVVISAKKGSRRKNREYGNSLFNTGTMRIDESNNGGSMALLISPKQGENLVYNAKLWVTYNSLPSFKVRVRIMDVDPVKGTPGKDLLNENIVVESDIKKGWLEFNLGKTTLKLKKDFYLVFEWVMDSHDRSLLSQQITSFLSDSPDAISTDSLIVGNEKINERTIKDFNNGVWFGTLFHQVMGKELTCYYRLNEFDQWKPSAAKLTGTVSLFE